MFFPASYYSRLNRKSTLGFAYYKVFLFTVFDTGDRVGAVIALIKKHPGKPDDSFCKVLMSGVLYLIGNTGSALMFPFSLFITETLRLSG